MIQDFSANWGGPRCCMKGSRGSAAEFLARGRVCLGDTCVRTNRNGLTKVAEMFSQGHAVCDLCAATMSAEAVAAADAAAEQARAKENHPQMAPMNAEKPVVERSSEFGVRRKTPPKPKAKAEPKPEPMPLPKPAPAPAADAVPTATETTPPPAPVDVEKLKSAIGGAVLELVVGNLCEHCVAMLLDKLRKGA